jgi:4-oxalocrotonate tautomerase
MPHVIVKLWPGKSEPQKARLAAAIARDVMDVLGLGEESVSVAMEEVKPQDWAEKVYKPDIVTSRSKSTRNRATTCPNCPDLEHQRREGRARRQGLIRPLGLIRLAAVTNR